MFKITFFSYISTKLERHIAILSFDSLSAHLLITSQKGEFKLTLLTLSLVSPQDIETEVVVHFFKTILVGSTPRTVVVKLLYSHGF